MDEITMDGNKVSAWFPREEACGEEVSGGSGASGNVNISVEKRKILIWYSWFAC